MNIFAICPKCGFETEITKDDKYVMCESCKSILSIEGNAKVPALVISKAKEIELISEIEKEAHKVIANWRYR